MYSVGADAPAVSENQVLTYTYYSSTLDSIDYSFFNFSKYLIENLPNYSNVFGTYEYTTGWYIDSQTLLKEANSSVYFADSISRTDFTSITYKYDYLNENTNQTTEKTLTYYAPTGSTSFVINDVTETDPVYVNVIVSTEMANSAYMSRYLALWKMDSINAEAGTAENLSTQSQYMNKFNQILKTPYAAIPLANHYDTSTGSKSTSLVKVGDDYYYLNEYGYDHLIAHTFIITEPGIYYLGSTDGTLAISYLSIDKMKDTAESEDSSKNISEDFTIDFVWGSVGSDSDFSQINSTSDDIEGAIGNIAYVGRVDSDDAKTWVHSNLYPEFVNGTPGVFEPDSNLDYYTIDLIKIEHLNSFAANTNYYIKNGNNYDLVDTANTEFDYSLDYYILDSGNYVLVHEGMNDSITYYYIINKDNKLYLEPATTYARNATYYRLDITMVSISDFDANTAYYVLDGDEYELAYNPFDYLNLSAERTYNNGITTTTINYETYDNNYYYGYGIMYINANKNSNKASRIIVLSYTEKQ